MPLNGSEEVLNSLGARSARADEAIE
jgi:hypothetical protein